MDEHVYTVVGIEANTFTNDSKLKKVTIANTITTIGRYCFSNCANIEEIYVPANTINIGRGLGWKDPCLKKFVIADANTKYKDEDGVAMLKDGKFLIACPQGKDYTNWTIPETAEEIGESCLIGTNIQTLNIPKKITKIGRAALISCKELKSLEINANIEAIPYSLCSENSNLETVKINSPIKEMTGFDSCSALKEINIPDTVEIIGTGGFYGCYALKNIVIPSNTKTIWGCAFYKCSNININFANYKNLTYVGDCAFPSNSVSDTNAKSYILSINGEAFKGYGGGFSSGYNGYNFEI